MDTFSSKEHLVNAFCALFDNKTASPAVKPFPSVRNSPHREWTESFPTHSVPFDFV